jgi:peptide chain release factor 3
VFDPGTGNTILLGAVGPLQFEIVAHRLQSEYKVDAVYDNANIHAARWVTFPDDAMRRRFENAEAARMAKDIDDNPVYLAPNAVNLRLVMERWPDVTFHSIREHGQRMEHA